MKTMEMDSKMMNNVRGSSKQYKQKPSNPPEESGGNNEKNKWNLEKDTGE